MTIKELFSSSPILNLDGACLQIQKQYSKHVLPIKHGTCIKC